MKHSARAPRVRRGTIALALAALVGGGLAIPPSSPAQAADTEVPKASLIGTGTSWKYLDDNTDPAAGSQDLNSWTAPSFDDSAWKEAPSGFGVKSNKLAPVGPHTPATKLEHYMDGASAPTVPTYFFRASFELEDGVAEKLDSATGTVLYDDALRVYVNGERVANYSDGRVNDSLDTNLQYAGVSASDPASSSFIVDGALLRDGTNTISVALYQDRETSSDAYFDMTEFKLLEAGTVIEAAPTRVILTPTETPSVSQAFSWLAGDATHQIGQIEIEPAAGGDTRTVDAAAVGRVIGNPNEHFTAIVDGLIPATDYRYRVGLPGSWSDWYEFSTEDPNATDFQFVYYGDAQIGLDTTWPKVVAQAEERATRSIGSVHAGDLIDTGGNDTQWRNWFSGMKNSAVSTNVMAAPGNHEYYSDPLLTAWKAHFEYPSNQPATESIGELAQLAVGDTLEAQHYRAYFGHWTALAAETVYYADYQNVRFITLNATADGGFLNPPSLPSCGSEPCPSINTTEMWTKFQAAWLDYVLKNSPSKWNVVTFHQPVYSTSSGRDQKVLRDNWVPVFEENNIDLVLMGHDHTYARGYKNSDRTSTVGMTTGPVYAVSNSGAKHYSLESEERNVWTNNSATQVLRGQNVTTYQVIDVTQDQLVYRSYLAEKPSSAKSFKLDTTATGDRPVYQPKDVPNVGDLYDEVTVTKYSTGEKWVTEAGVDVPAAPAVNASATTVEQGGEVTFSGAGFTPDSEVKIELHSTPVSLGTATVGSDGSFSAIVTIPADTPTDVEHSLVAILPNGSMVSVPLAVTPAADGGTGTAGGSGAAGGAGTAGGAGNAGAGGSGNANTGNSTPLSNTGGTSYLPYGIAGTVLLLAGTAILVARRRMAAHHELVVGAE